MRGLIYKDLIAFFRKTHIVSWIFDIVFICVFIFAIPGAGAVPTYLLLVQPINMSGAASTLKELDTNYSGRICSDSAGNSQPAGTVALRCIVFDFHHTSGRMCNLYAAPLFYQRTV